MQPRLKVVSFDICPYVERSRIALLEKGVAAGGASGDALAKPVGTLRDAFGKLETQLARGGGPYFLGRDFSLVDASNAPFFRRWRMAERWGPNEARLLASFPTVSAWVDAMLARPSVAAAEPADLDAKSRRFYEQRAAQQRATAG